MKPSASIPMRREEILWQAVEGQVVLIDRDEGTLIRLNEIGGAIWHAIDGRRTIDEIVDRLCETFDVTRARAQQDVLRFVKDLKRRELVDERDGSGRNGGHQR